MKDNTPFLISTAQAASSYNKGHFLLFLIVQVFELLKSSNTGSYNKSEECRHALKEIKNKTWFL